MRASRAQVKEYQLNLTGGMEEVTKRRKPVHEEAMHQAALMAHRAELQEAYPNLRFLFSTLNGLFMPPHIRARAIEAGMAKGILDLFYMVRRVEADGNVFSGLVMDLKRLKGGRPTPEQLEWSSHLAEQGYRVYFPSGCVEAWRILCCYQGISGRDHIAEGLVQREESIRRTCEI
jgi:hypothetical protein